MDRDDMRALNEAYDIAVTPDFHMNTEIDSSIIRDVNDAYREGVPFDQQIGSIEAFFKEGHEYWEHIGLDTLDGSDEESTMMIDNVLANCSMPSHIREMLTSWKVDGF